MPCAWLWFSLPIFVSAQAHAQGSASEAITFTFGNSECPEPSAVEREVRRLIPQDRQSVLDAGVRIELQDLGESYRVTVSKDGSTLKKSYADAARDCDGRARFAAVFAVLTIMPPELEASEPKPEPAPPPPPAPLPTPSVVRPIVEAPALPPLAHVELSGLFVGALALEQAPKIGAWGGQLGVAFGRGAISGTLSFGYVARARFELSGVEGDIVTLPASVGVRASSELGPVTIAGDLGLLALIEQVRATNLARTSSDHALDLGVRAAVSLAWPVGRRFAPFIGAFSWIVPAPRELYALPQGVIGSLPDWWIGGAAGVALGL